MGEEKVVHKNIREKKSAQNSSAKNIVHKIIKKKQCTKFMGEGKIVHKKIREKKSAQNLSAKKNSAQKNPPKKTAKKIVHKIHPRKKQCTKKN